jgi:hypothetical protein
MSLNKCEADVVVEARAKVFDSLDPHGPTWREIVYETSRAQEVNYHERLATYDCTEALVAYRAGQNKCTG